MKNKLLISILIISAFLIVNYFKYFLGYVVFGKEHWNALDKNQAELILLYSQITLVILSGFLIFGKQTFKKLGLGKGLLNGLIIGFIATVPMLIGYGILKNFNFHFDWYLIHRDFIQAGFFEEFSYRGFLFGLLFYFAGWGFIPAVIIPSVFFGLGHLYQSDSIIDSINIFLFTGLGSAGFAWFYTAFSNLWVLIFLHGFMDFAWDFWQIQTNVTGDLYVNLFRFMTLGIMIFLSINEIKKHPENSISNKMFINKTE